MLVSDEVDCWCVQVWSLHRRACGPGSYKAMNFVIGVPAVQIRHVPQRERGDCLCCLPCWEPVQLPGRHRRGRGMLVRGGVHRAGRGSVCGGAGSFKGVNGSSECVWCASGTYLNASAGTACVGCPAGNLST
eukprot:1504841-Rhodomonas_salina.1